MPKRKLTAKLKKQIKESPFRLRKDDFAGDALAYLNRVRGAIKAKKTKDKKEKYKAPRKKSEREPVQVQALIDMAARSKGMTPKQFEKKFPKDVAQFRNEMILVYNREIDLMKLDILFFERGRKIFNVGKRIKKSYSIYILTRVKNKIIETGLTYDRVNLRHHYDGSRALHIEVPIPIEYKNMSGWAVLDFIKEFYPNITYYLRKDARR